MPRSGRVQPRSMIRNWRGRRIEGPVLSFGSQRSTPFVRNLQKLRPGPHQALRAVLFRRVSPSKRSTSSPSRRRRIKSRFGSGGSGKANSLRRPRCQRIDPSTCSSGRCALTSIGGFLRCRLLSSFRCFAKAPASSLANAREGDATHEPGLPPWWSRLLLWAEGRGSII
jgi:hypothetical protein